uniref:Homeobox domain-containing protein n=1 Tax=Globodera pallida TaxID=36090 RepID=A0A183CFG7_GLOPA
MREMSDLKPTIFPEGLIQINNWKPISFETITDNPEELVINLFREISTHITLKILAKRSPTDTNGQCIVDLKQRLLKTSIEKQPQILTSSNGQEVKEILQQVMAGDDECSAWKGVREQSEAVNEWLEQIVAQQENNRKSPLSSTRFSPVSELPRLERWFRSDPNPTRQKLLSYANILNAAAYRRANNKVTYQQICNWFANQRRTRQRAIASRQSSSSAAYQIPNGVSGAQRQPQALAMLPLNAAAASSSNSAGGVVPSTGASGIQQIAASAATGDPQAQQKLAAALVAQLSGSAAGAGTPTPPTTTALMMTNNSGGVTDEHQRHQIPFASGPLDIRSKFESYAASMGASTSNTTTSSAHLDTIVSDTEPSGHNHQLGAVVVQALQFQDHLRLLWLRQQPHVILTINGHMVAAMCDPGCQTSMVTNEVALRTGLDICKQNIPKFVGAGNIEKSAYGTVQLKMTLHDNRPDRPCGTFQIPNVMVADLPPRTRHGLFFGKRY